jgi:hypothetical protein
MDEATLQTKGTLKEVNGCGDIFDIDDCVGEFHLLLHVEIDCQAWRP